MEFGEEHGGEAPGKDGHLRIYIGGLGGGITADDLKKTFSTPQLGSVESVEIIRTKGRSIAYLDFRPCSEKGLAKLFSTYNGCLWKGGKLRLEKAKEHYMLRMKREWEEDAQLSSIADECVDSVESISPPEKLGKDRISESVPLRIFFPKLRKVKPISFKGTGKHKYSFQRVAVPSLPVHFCDCDEHSASSDIAKGSYNHENEVYGIKEEELDMMNSVMNKLFERKKDPQPTSSKARAAKEVPIPTNSNDEAQIDDDADEMSDEEGLIINVVGRSGDTLITNKQESRHSQSRPFQRKREIQGKKPFQQASISEPAYSTVEQAAEVPSPTASKNDFEVEISDDDDFVINVVSGSNNKIPSADFWGQKIIAGDKELQASQSERKNGKRVIQETKTVRSNKERKVAPAEDKNGELSASKTKRDLHKTSVDVETPSHNQAAELDSGVQPSSTNDPHAKRFSWRDLVSGRDNGCFHISDVVPSEPPMVEKQPRSETPADVFDQGNITSEVKVMRTTSEVLPQMPKAETSKAEESTSPAQKFSWRHLVGGSDDGSFSISQIVPGPNIKNQEQHVMESNPGPTNLNLSVQMPDIARSGELAFSSELPSKLTMAAKQTSRRDGGVGEATFTFKKSDASIKEWKIAKAAVSGLRKKNTAKN